jgi:hypothetical protein
MGCPQAKLLRRHARKMNYDHASFRWSRFKAGEVVFAPAAMAICAIVELALFVASWKGQGPQTLAIKPIAPANSLLDKLHPGIDLIGAENNASSLRQR